MLFEYPKLSLVEQDLVNKAIQIYTELKDKQQKVIDPTVLHQHISLLQRWIINNSKDGNEIVINEVPVVSLFEMDVKDVHILYCKFSILYNKSHLPLEYYNYDSSSPMLFTNSQ